MHETWLHTDTIVQLPIAALSHMEERWKMRDIDNH